VEHRPADQRLDRFRLSSEVAKERAGFSDADVVEVGMDGRLSPRAQDREIGE